MEHVGYECCFCAKAIEEKVAVLIVVSNYEKPKTKQYSQLFFCHIPCFTSKLNNKTKSYLVNLDDE